MTAQTIQRLQELARTDSAVAPLARLQAEALQAATHRTWDDGLPPFERERLNEGLPLLHGRMLAVDAEHVRSLLSTLARTVEQTGGTTGVDLRRVVSGKDLDPLSLLEASITQDASRLELLAAESRVEAGLLATLGGLAALPLLQACGRKAAPLLERAVWEEGYCPVCAAWATLAELRGLEKRRWLRCGRCGAGWAVAHDGCVFCSETDWRRLRYLAPEGETEARRAATCDACHSYLKTLTSLTLIGPADVALSDVMTLELDMAALEREFARPTLPGFPLQVHVEPAKRRSFWSRR